jgi:hypothetical protein
MAVIVVVIVVVIVAVIVVVIVVVTVVVTVAVTTEIVDSAQKFRSTAPMSTASPSGAPIHKQSQKRSAKDSRPKGMNVS